LPAHGLPDGIAKGSAAIAPIETGVAYFIGGLLQRIEPLDVINDRNDPLRELCH
jgi:hypothetical protein